MDMVHHRSRLFRIAERDRDQRRDECPYHRKWLTPLVETVALRCDVNETWPQLPRGKDVQQTLKVRRVCLRVTLQCVRWLQNITRTFEKAPLCVKHGMALGIGDLFRLLWHIVHAC